MSWHLTRRGIKRVVTGWTIVGEDLTPDGYRDHLLYKGTSRWQAFRAVRAALREDMTVTIRRYLVAK
ncbi:hypothetical protein SEA_JEMMNO_28 [Mycobacterium phage Jemmno]|uniref:Uncharacterized protein n=3 Tax=Bixzunavirus TaxID=680114 RepID=A0A0F7IJX4_9CAUD|nr:hypothetical protein KHO64_gp028 [Mycobacterium phage Quasimodo]AEJ94890.1 hypothetical protein GHOST_28 [Mycobacterium phage Ghost]AKG94594.1 hypothetical protein SEA_MOMO_27 [Mycobacterium phage Momo]ATN87252.1 hypothetical protein SEA_AUDRICK_30 [Mycobacterium phage Audrick]AXY85544.1 hypothetical protein SEA_INIGOMONTOYA_29 [Mycobacterium phage InigoMontoya]AXY85779.1 hypothetical protein SEA_PHLEGM_30 [Mycobacterium phage Phlegm]QAX94081.1 hypothetical protein SEA_ADLITAM_28 [Mycobact